MVKVIIVYESKYGNTKHVAETILEGMKEIEGVETHISELKEVNLREIQGFDAILIGSPNHIGGPTRSIKGFIDKLSKLNLHGKKFAVFDTYLAVFEHPGAKMDFEKAVRKMERRMSEKAPGLKQIAPGLSVRVKGMRGPVAENELPQCREYGRKIAIQLKTGG